MSSKERSQFVDVLEPFYGQLDDSVVERLIPRYDTSLYILDDLLLASTNFDVGPAEFLNSMVISIPDESLHEFVGLVKAIEALTTADLEARGERGANYLRAFQPSFERSELLADGLLAVPIGDRNSLRDYIVKDEVSRALDSYMTYKNLFGVQDGKMKPRKNAELNNKKRIGPRVSGLEETFEPMRQEDLFDRVDRRYWKSKDKEKYLHPEDTLEDIVNKSTDQSLIRLLLRFEDYIERQEDGSPSPIIQDKSPGRYYVGDGIVWQIHTISSIRSQMVTACRNDVTGFGGPNIFDFDRFRDEYIAEYTDPDAPGEKFKDDLDWAIRSRHYNRTGLH